MGPAPVWTSTSCLDIAPDGRTTALLVGAPGQSRIEIWDLVTSELITNKRLKTAPFTLKGTSIDAAAFSPDGSMLVVSARNDNYYWKWHTSDEPIHIHAGRRLESLLFSPDGRLLAEGPGPRSDMDIRDLANMRVIQSLRDEVKRSLTVDGMAFVDQGRTLIAGNSTTFIPSVKVPHRIHFWDVASGKLTRQIALDQGLPRSLDVSRDGKTLAVVIEPYRAQAAAPDHEPGQPNEAGHSQGASPVKTVLAFWDLDTPPGATPKKRQ
jgi:WD40 repeat protein